MPRVEGFDDIGILSCVKVDSIDKECRLDSVSVQEICDGANSRRAVVDSNGNCLWAHARLDQCGRTSVEVDVGVGRSTLSVKGSSSIAVSAVVGSSSTLAVVSTAITSGTNITSAAGDCGFVCGASRNASTNRSRR